MFYSIARFLVAIYIHLFYRINVIGAENIPEGGIIICSNHLSLNDPVLLGVGIKRHITYIAKKELFKNKFFGLILKNLTAIPIDRSTSDMSAFKTVVSRLKEGAAVGIFAQGTRVKELDTKQAKAGVALFAYKAGVPIVPVCITASYKLFSEAYINIGKPISLEEYAGVKLKTDQLSDITEKVMEEISALQISKNFVK